MQKINNKIIHKCPQRPNKYHVIKTDSFGWTLFYKEYDSFVCNWKNKYLCYINYCPYCGTKLEK